MHTFLRGYDSSFLEVAQERLASAAAALTDPRNDEERAIVEKAVSEEAQHLDDHFQSLSWDRFVQPMIGTVAAMPATDLARVAESFVGLQVLRQLTQAEMETVGGPIDVAVITRADGFRWVSGKSLPA